MDVKAALCNRGASLCCGGSAAQVWLGSGKYIKDFKWPVHVDGPTTAAVDFGMLSPIGLFI
jgi:hypothetical protein